MWDDPIVEEVRKAREEHAARFDYDLDRIFQDLKERERQSGKQVVSLSPRRPVSSPAGGK
jgi:hypothetical protein